MVVCRSISIVCAGVVIACSVATGGAAPASKRTTLARLGVSIVLPAKTRWSYRSNYPEQAEARLGYQQLVRLQKLSRKPPANKKQVETLWARAGKPLRVLAQGKTKSGVFFTARTYRVRGGSFNRASGRHVHSLMEITRVFGLVRTGAKTYVRCTAYLELGAQSSTDAPVRRALNVCTSMRPAAK